MSGPQPSFGRRGVPNTGRVRRPAAAAPSRPAAEPTKARPDANARAGFHGSHFELHWPKYVAGAGAIFALGYLVSSGKTDAFGLILVPILFAAIAYFALNGIRKKLDDMHTLRTSMFRTPAFATGAVAGFGCFIYTTFISPSTVLGIETGIQTTFDDGFQPRDLGAVALLLLEGAGLTAAGGAFLEFVAKRVGFGSDDDTGS